MPYNPCRPGHEPGHPRDAFYGVVVDGLDAAAAEVEVGHSDRRRAVRWLIGQLWNCTDMMPSPVRQAFTDTSPFSPEPYTVGAGVRRLKKLDAAGA